ncbi:class I SAM-dependent methyltransferase [Actinocorallia populi]|uniref:class I SAM-dependent methyltransferase n=1 Tax=Actinocorallia populi TaxID=2079200 RepID=UPI0013009FF8|nr:class I SAM-dependent methyltransferase [Actinocorallia populi]
MDERARTVTAPHAETGHATARAAHGAGLAALGGVPLDRIPEQVRRLDLAVLTGIAAHLGERLPRSCDAAEAARILQTAPRHAWIPGHWLAALAGEGLAPRRHRRAELVEARKAIDEARRTLGYPPELTRYLLDSLRHLSGLLRDEVSAQALLFPDGDLGVAEAAYRDNLINLYLNAAAARTVRDLGRTRILELGAGTGSLTADLLPVLDGHTSEYLFTDLSPFFLEHARTRFPHPFLRYEVVDLDADLAARCGADPFDLVVAVNAAHNASHVGDLLGRIRDLLAPGGALLLVETGHEHHQSLASMPFLLSGRTERRDQRAGTHRTYLTREEWLAALTAAGLRPALDLPHPGHPLAAFSQFLLLAHR